MAVREKRGKEERRCGNTRRVRHRQVDTEEVGRKGGRLG